MHRSHFNTSLTLVSHRITIKHCLIQSKSRLIFQFQYMLKLSKEATVEGMKDALQRKTGVAPANVSLSDFILNFFFHRIFVFYLNL